MSHKPPRWPGRILNWLSDSEIIDEIEGDLKEMYAMWVAGYGVRKARRLYVWHSLKFIRPFILKKRNRPMQKAATLMMLDHIKMAMRNLRRHRAFALINVLGLALSMACVLLIFSLIKHHLTFDHFHKDRERIYRVYTEYHGDDIETWNIVPQPLGKAIREDLTFAEVTARIRTYRSVVVSLPDEKGNMKFQEEGKVAFAEPEYFEIFNFPLVNGSHPKLLSRPNAAILTKTIAFKYFGTTDVIGKLLTITSFGTRVDFAIVGVLEDFPQNTDLKVQIFLSYENLKDYNAYYASDKSWGSINNGMQCYVRLKQDVSPDEMNAALPRIVSKYYDDVDSKLFVFKLQSLEDIHFNAALGAAFTWKHIWVLGVIGAFLIAIASVNFINLASSQILIRSREVGIRKTLGGKRIHLFAQFMTETSIVALLAMVLSYGAAQLILPYFSTLVHEQFSLNLFRQWELSCFILAMLTFVVFISGTYPALLMSRFQPVKALKANISNRDIGGFSIKRVLMVTQFVISQVLIISMLVIGNQTRFSKTSDLGFDKNAIVMTPIPIPDVSKMKTLKNRVSEIRGVIKTTLCFEAPASQSNTLTSVRYDTRTSDETWEINLKEGDNQYLNTFGIKLVAGRNLLQTDSTNEFLVNETFVRKLGLSSNEAALGKKMAVNGGTIHGTIEGVVKDFNNNSLHDAISPICLLTNYTRFKNIGIKLSMSDGRSAIQSLAKIWQETYPDALFTYKYVDEDIARFYEADTTALKLIEIFSGIAIAVSCLGLYGMVSFMAVRKTKEVAVRKALGAGVTNILWIFSQEFILLIVIAFLIAGPISWILMDRWLHTFTYRLPISPWSFIMAALATLAIAAITISYHSIKSAHSNPVNSLRSDG